MFYISEDIFFLFKQVTGTEIYILNIQRPEFYIWLYLIVSFIENT